MADDPITDDELDEVEARADLCLPHLPRKVGKYVPRLVDEVRRLREENERLREALDIKCEDERQALMALAKAETSIPGIDDEQ